MAGQGSTICDYALWLKESDWTVVYTCVPNTPHVGVVAIPIAGSRQQQYPDILAFKGGVTRIVEVELQLTAAVAEKIRERFEDILKVLCIPEEWNTFRRHVQETTRMKLPEIFRPDCELVICRNGKRSAGEFVPELAGAKVRVVFAEDLFS